MLIVHTFQKQRLKVIKRGLFGRAYWQVNTSFNEWTTKMIRLDHTVIKLNLTGYVNNLVPYRIEVYKLVRR